MPFDGVNLPEIATLLMTQRAQIEAGWCQKVMRKRGWEYCVTDKDDIILQCREQVCMMGVVRSWETSSILHQAIENLNYGKDGEGIVDFNDALYRTKEQILAVYDRAIELSLR